MGRTFGRTTGAAAPEHRDQTDVGTGLIKVTSDRSAGRWQGVAFLPETDCGRASSHQRIRAW